MRRFRDFLVLGVYLDSNKTFFASTKQVFENVRANVIVICARLSEPISCTST